MLVIRQILFFGDKIIDFYTSQDEMVRVKIEYVLDLVRFERHIPNKFFKKLENTDGIYEVRVITSQKSIRILCFQDDGNLVVLTNGLIKKTQKTPRNEIKLAEKLRSEYFKMKQNENKNI